MSLGAILDTKDFQDDYSGLLTRIGLEGSKSIGTIRLSQATRREFRGTAVGSYQGTTVLINHFLPYDCSHRPDQMNPLDERLADLSVGEDVLCFYLDDTSMSFGFSVFQNGSRIRCRKVDPDQIYSDFGQPLAAEAPFDPADRDDSERIMALSAVFLDRPLGQLVLSDDLMLVRYDRFIQ